MIRLPTSVALLPVDADELFPQTVTAPPSLRNIVTTHLRRYNVAIILPLSM